MFVVVALVRIMNVGVVFVVVALVYVVNMARLIAVVLMLVALVNIMDVGVVFVVVALVLVVGHCAPFSVEYSPGHKQSHLGRSHYRLFREDFQHNGP